jgi:hypothetical protein
MPTTNLGWLRSPTWDVGLLAFGWLPFYAWVAAASGMTAQWGLDGTPSFTAAVAVALALNFIHRQYVLVLVYGDRETFAERPRAYALAPLVSFALVGTVLASGPAAAKSVLVAGIGSWNVWHVIQQRYGLLRVYAARARGGLETRAAARVDMAVLWSSVALTTCAVAAWWVPSLAGFPQAAYMRAIVEPLARHGVLGSVTAAAGGVWVWSMVRWLRLERAVPGRRWPRWIFALSTFALLAIFVVQGPVVGYVVFGVAHSIEYLAFVYQFGEKKYDRGTHNVAALVVGSVRRAPLLLVPLLVGYAFLYQHRFALAYATYYVSTSILHYLYDGWIWRLRQSRVARPLGAVG